MVLTGFRIVLYGWGNNNRWWNTYYIYDVYVVTVPVVSNFIKREDALGKIGTWDFETYVGVNVVNGVTL